MAKNKGKRRRGGSGNTALTSAAWAIAGGATGAVVGHMLRENKVKPNTVSVGLVATGLVGATSLTGNSRWFAAGLATSGASQYATNWAEVKLKRKGIERDADPAALPEGQQAQIHVLPSRNQGDVDIVAAFEEAQSELEEEEAA